MDDPSSGDESSAAPATRLNTLDRAIRRLEAANRSAPRRTAEWLLTEVLDCDRAHLYAQPNRELSPEAARRFEQMVERRAEGEPLQHILGYASFYGLNVQVSPEVMVPRPETEIVVDRVLDCLEGTEEARVLDVGTGSGCLALAIKHECPDASVYACDVSSAALSVARTNATSLDLRVQFLEADVTAGSPSARMPDELDLLVSNPPYIPDSEADSLPAVVRDYDPERALFAGDDPLRFYRALVDWSHALCHPEAWIVVEVHAEYGADVASLFRREGVSNVCMEEDFAGQPRVVWGRVPRADTD